MKQKELTKRIIQKIQYMLRNGIRGNLDELLNYRRSWSLKLQSELDDSNGTSLSDTDSYQTICRLAVERDQVFRKFKSCKEYQEVLEHVSRNLGSEYLKVLKKDEWISDRLPELVIGDIGNPHRFTYPGLGRISPTHLRYAKVASDLRSLFGPLGGYDIAEIGVGYGGQSVILDKLFEIKTYKMFDLPVVLELAQKYTRECEVKMSVERGNLSNSGLNSYDLVISNYAFSELKGQVQEDYLLNVIQKSKRGYFTYNDISPLEYDAMSAIKFAEKIVGAELYREFPTTAPKNVLVIWGHNRDSANAKLEKVI
jgi:hypothetical protein